MNPLRALLDAIERRRLRRIARRRLETILRRDGVVKIYVRSPGDAGLRRSAQERRSAQSCRTVFGAGAKHGMKSIAGIVGVCVLGWPVAARPLGNVAVSVTEGRLSVVGDDDANGIELSMGGERGAIVVTGIDGTVVNEGASAAVTGVRTIRIDMKAGRDSVALQDVDLERRLRVQLGPDRDTFVLKGGRVQGGVALNGGRKGGDEVTVEDARIGGRLVLATGRNRDVITVRNVSIGGGLDVRSGEGNDTILVDHTAVDSGETDMDTGSGDDRLEVVDVDFGDDAEVDLGDGDDDLRVEDCDFDGEVDADGGDGDDELKRSGDNSFDVRERMWIEDFEEFD
jgi:hypothetical protein